MWKSRTHMELYGLWQLRVVVIKIYFCKCQQLMGHILVMLIL